MPQGARVVGGVPSAAGAGGWVWPAVAIAPVGWSQVCFYLAQRYMVRPCLAGLSLSKAAILFDHGPAPRVDGERAALL
eukprot:11200818-Lingulodinium_polyedra.AAC.1